MLIDIWILDQLLFPHTTYCPQPKTIWFYYHNPPKSNQYFVFILQLLPHSSDHLSSNSYRHVDSKGHAAVGSRQRLVGSHGRVLF